MSLQCAIRNGLAGIFLVSFATLSTHGEAKDYSSQTDAWNGLGY